MSGNYDIQTLFGGVTLTHGGMRPRLLADVDSDYSGRRHDVAVLVASGDCFITLATTLDDCTKHLTSEESVALPQIEQTISLLEHLQRHYQIVRKPPES
jgi:hypothetical protein